MKKIYLLLLMSANIIYAQNAGFSDITGIDILDENNYQSFIVSDDLNDLLLNGWAISGVIQVKVFVNGGSEGSASPDNGTWEENVDVSEGINEAYLEVTCNSSCSPSISTTTPITFNYVKPFEVNEFAVFTISGTTDIEIDWSESRGYVPRNTNFFYRVWRNTEEVIGGANFTAITPWTDNRNYVDDSIKQSNTTYYYWIESAIDNEGSHNSGLVVNNSKNISFGTLSNTELKYINTSVYPNPVTSNTITVESDNLRTNGQWSLISIIGEKVRFGNYTNIGNKVFIRLPNIQKGIYILHIQTSTGIVSKKIIIN